ncbi:MAG: FHA domain-containing protein [candidate division KSB1 bacterium]|nr:FHA domain-containing protein [candidate division KSB1 bacterium]MDZ7366636.1 FHA domain-containing protein [candidate division KSB1 bacterium]MDZ7404647.1 FHA domain-containing protein [candidate division KSB1 bacterium]
MPKLILKRKAEVLREFALPGTNSAFTVGSEPGNDVVVSDKLVSMTHFQIERQAQQFFVRDLKSAFGTYVNGTKIGSVQELHDGDVIQIGEHTLVFQNSVNDNAGQSAGGFLNDVKDAVMKAGDNEAIKRSRIAGSSIASESKSEFHRAGAASYSRVYHHTASNEIDVNDLEEEISEVLNKAGVRRESSTSSRTSTTHNKKLPYYLLAIHGPYLGKKYQLNFGETKIGRDSKLNDIVIRLNAKGEVDPSISRRHATITYRDGKFYFTDKRSQSRSYVNRQKVGETDEVCLMPGDEIEIVSDQQSTIFRFVAEGNWDFSLPKRAGEWWLRYRMQAINAATAAVLLFGLIFTLIAWRNHALITDVPNPFAAEAKIFSKLNMTGTLKTSPSARDRDWVPAPVLAELNGDDEVDILITQASGVLLAINGETRKPLWETSTIILDRSCAPAAADINGNGMADVIALTADGHLAAIDGFFGAEIWTSPFFEKEMIGPPVIADFNGDGYADVAVISVEGKLNVGYSQVFNMQWVEVDIGLECQAPLSAADLYGDGRDEIIIGTERGIVLIYDGVERRVTTTFDFNEELNKLKGSFFEDNPIRHPIGVADLNGDKTPDLIMSSRSGNLLCVSLVEKNVSQAGAVRSLWWAALASGRINEPDFAFPFALADLDNDEGADIVVLTDDGSLKAFRGRGTVGQRQPEMWQSKPDSTHWVSSPVVADFDNDGAADIVVVNGKPSLKILNGKNGKVLWRDDQVMANVTSMPLLADLSDDARLDVILLASNGAVHQFATNRRVPGGKILWGQKFGPLTNASALINIGPSALGYTVQMIIFVIVVLSAVTGNLLYQQSRRRLGRA